MRLLRVWVRRRNWRLSVARGAVVAVVFVVAAYVTLPWWLPTGWLGRRLVADMSGQLGVPVRIRNMKTSWGNGVEINGLEIDSPEGFAVGPMVTVGRIRADLAPLSAIFRGRIGWMEIVSPRLVVHVDEDGQVNAAVFKKFSSSVRAGRINVHRASAIVHLPDQPELHLSVNHATFRAGRVQALRNVTVSAAIEQADEVAPVSLEVVAGRPAEPIAARAEVKFTRISLGTVDLPKLLDLPLEALSGQLSGSLGLQINREGKVEQFDLHLSAANLQVTPSNAPALPMIDHAELSLGASYDPLQDGGRFEVQSLAVRVPDALELTGRAVLFGEALSGKLEAIEALHLDGQVQPDQLSAMLTGRNELLETGVTVAGPVAVSARIDHTGPRIDLQLGADASEAVIRRGDETLKPAGRALSGSIAGALDQRTWRCDLTEGQLTLGENEWTGEGSVSDIRRLRRGADDELTAHAVAGALRGIDGQGRWRISDLAAIRDMLGNDSLLADVTLTGTASGHWAIRRDTGRLECAAALPGEADMTIGKLLAKPAGRAVSVQVSATLDQKASAVTDIQADLTAGRSRVRIDNASVSYDADGRMATAGQFDALRIEGFLASLPPLRKALGDWRGRLQGGYRLSADAEGIAAEMGFTEVRLIGPADQATPTDDALVATATLTGPLELAGQCRFGQDGLSVHVNARADELTVSSGGDRPRRKPAGMPLRVTAAAEGIGRDEGAAGEVTFELADNLLVISDVSLTDELPIGGSFHGRLTVGKAWGSLAPELGSWLEAMAVAGDVTATGRFEYDDKAVKIAAQFDATDLAVGSQDGFRKERGLPAGARVQGRVAGDLSSFRLSMDQGRVGDVMIAGDVHGDPTVLAGRLRMSCEETTAVRILWPAGPVSEISGAAELQLTCRQDDGEIQTSTTLTAEDIAGALAKLPIGLDGKAQIDIAVDSAKQAMTIRSVRADGLAFRLGRSSGWLVTDMTGPTALLEKLAEKGDRTPSQLIREAVPTPAVKGTVHVIGERIDAVELAEWSQRLVASVWPLEEDALFPGASEHKVALGAKPVEGKFTDERLAAIDAAAADAVEVIRPIIANSDLTVRVAIDNFHTFDEVISKPFHLKNMWAACTISDGECRIEYAAGLNSGSLRRYYTVNVKDESPVMQFGSELRNARADETIRTLVAWRFPGNTVNGLFSHSEDMTAPFARAVAAAINPWYPVHEEGTGKTVATDGIAEGQAAPKFVTKIFPGLNTARYRYERMTSFATHRADGTVINDTVFDGSAYDTYMNGQTSADQMGRYEIGVILLSSPQSPEWNHTYRQGRVPIFKFQGRIYEGQVHDVKVTYPWPTETLYTVFLENNYFYRLWLAGKQEKQAKSEADGQPGPPDDTGPQPK
ncbi:MAG: hypothetical protein ACYS8X_08445 [Planctomycetota bacterium]|jgi:uncharacterized protein involved in outer membrane biogenesis